MTILSEIQQQNPLILLLSNSVTQFNVANTLSFIGASPIISNEVSEAPDLVQSSKALVLNLGTICQYDIDFFIKSGKLANKMKIPVILDPAGVSIPFRLEAFNKIISNVKIAVIRGNASEIDSIISVTSVVSGIDSNIESGEISTAINAAIKFKSIIVQTGKIDIITDGKKVLKTHHGSILFKINVGCGDMLSALIATFTTVSLNIDTVCEAVEFFNKCGETAEKGCANSPSQFIPKLLDGLYTHSHDFYKEGK